ncbi:hypothetical protein STEG23_021735 [Scotinomys teguina]
MSSGLERPLEYTVPSNSKERQKLLSKGRWHPPYPSEGIGDHCKTLYTDPRSPVTQYKRKGNFDFYNVLAKREQLNHKKMSTSRNELFLQSNWPYALEVSSLERQECLGDCHILNIEKR